MHRSRSLAVLVSTLALLAGLMFLAGCGADSPAGPTAPRARSQPLKPGSGRPSGPGCEFARGVTTCRTTTAQRVETETRRVFHGCVAFNGSEFVPGQRTETFEDQVEVSDVTTTVRHGRSGRVFDTTQSTERLTLSSALVSDVCVPITGA